MEIEFNQLAWLWYIFTVCAETPSPTNQAWPPIGIGTRPPYLWWVLPSLLLLSASFTSSAALGVWFRQKTDRVICILLGVALVLLGLFIAQQLYVFSQASFSLGNSSYSADYFFLSGNFMSNVLVCLAFVLLSLIIVCFSKARVAQGVALGLTALMIAALALGWLTLSYALGFCPTF